MRFHPPKQRVGDPLPNWWAGSERPLVYLTLGTVMGHMSIAADLYRTALRVMDELDVRVLLTVGRQFDPLVLGQVPSHVHIEDWVDQSRVLAEADLVVCHGGSGTVFGTIEQGLALVVLPAFSDQFANGPLVAEHGLGLVVEANPNTTRATTGSGRAVLTQDDSPRIADAVRQVLEQGHFRDRSRKVAAEMWATPTADQVLDRLQP